MRKMKLYDLSGNEIGSEYYISLNSAWDGHIFDFMNGEKIIFARKYGGMGFNQIWETTPRGFEQYETYRRQGRLI